ncbi:tetratricopeptide repeat protein [Neptunomonas phycophila]|uniref:Tetratricopeptide repeat protein n=1 Tax=Neptunomonas phycophila TaxID=1572645 RepID=A0ABT9EU67_9GAMM|nr:tetratricopeptide repeat protein [Neptunomonas phycophila]MDP2522615.1 tetratricopeptide repeat protein [Neptunomonas phycophila]
MRFWLRYCAVWVTWLSLLLPSVGWSQADSELPDGFMSEKPSIQLFKAYAEFKMANYEMAKMMWQNIQGNARPEALFNLGILYDEGKGVEASITQAIQYYEAAAQAGSRAAAYQLGAIYLHDKRIASDKALANHWLSIAALRGDKDAARMLGRLDNVNDDMVEVRVLLAEGKDVEAANQLITLAELGNIDAKAELAWLYEAGIGVKKDLNQAATLFAQAAEGGSADAQYAIAVMSLTGTGVVKDKAAGVQWLRKAAAQHHPSAIKVLVELTE